MDTNLDLQISNLADHPKHFQTVCTWVWEEWWRSEGSTMEDMVYFTRHCLEKEEIPMTFVGLLEGKPVATASLWRSDPFSRQDLTPWLAAMYVIPERRGRGIGTLMQHHVIGEARRLEYLSIYLMTDHTGYYEKAGWSFLETAPLLNGKKTRLYRYNLSPQDPNPSQQHRS